MKSAADFQLFLNGWICYRTWIAHIAAWCLCFYLPQWLCGQSGHVRSLRGVAHQAGNKNNHWGTAKNQLHLTYWKLQRVKGLGGRRWRGLSSCIFRRTNWLWLLTNRLTQCWRTLSDTNKQTYKPTGNQEGKDMNVNVLNDLEDIATLQSLEVPADRRTLLR